MSLKVGITYNLKKNLAGTASDPPDAEAEFDDISTILAIQNALEGAGCRTELLEADASLPGRLSQNPPDIVFNVAEGSAGRGREAQVPALLSYLKIPYTGSDETTMCIAMDKALTKSLLAPHRVRTPKYRVASVEAAYSSGKHKLQAGAAAYSSGAASFSAGGLSFPVIVKPNAEGSSKGISGASVAHDAESLRAALEAGIGAYRQDMLVEEYVQGREFTVGILGNAGSHCISGRPSGGTGGVTSHTDSPGAYSSGGIHVFAPMEIVFRDGRDGIYSYAVKQNFKEHVDYKCPPEADPGTVAELARTAEKVFRALRCRDFARVDFRMGGDGRLYFIEINPLPGLAPGYSDYPMLAEFCGVGYDALICGILGRALARYGMGALNS